MRKIKIYAHGGILCHLTEKTKTNWTAAKGKISKDGSQTNSLKWPQK